MRTWFTADLHFYHKQIVNYCGRPWQSVEEMNEGLITLWNNDIHPDDIVYILGDMFFCGTTKAKEIMNRLNGRKRLIRGNHDWNVIKLHRAEEFGFEWACDQFCLRIGREDVILSHFPYSGDHTVVERYKEKRPKDEGRFLLHGHVHDKWLERGRQINVGVDVWNWRPVELSIINYMIQRAVANGK